MTTKHMPQDALRWCHQLVRERAGNFYWGLRLLPEPKRSGLFALYAWMRAADDIADDATAPLLAMDELQIFEDRTGALYGTGDVAEGPMWEGMHWAVGQFGLSHQPLLDMIQGQRHDLLEGTIDTADDLFEYCRCVASTVGQLCIEIWGYNDSAAPALAVDRGIALQLTNILRDIGEDLDMGRCYLPTDELEAAGLTRDALRIWEPEHVCETLVCRWVDEAERRYEASAPLDAMIDRDCRATLRAMTGIYHALLRQIARRPCRTSLGPRASVSAIGKVGISLRARMRG